MKNRVKKLLSYLVIISLLLSLSNIQLVNAATKYYKMTVSYIDVGESDCVLIQSYGHSMLLDAGDSDDEKTIIGYLNKKKVKKLDYLILTHPHADHISGADEVIEEFTIGKIIMPTVAHTTQTFENLLDTIEDNNLKITKPKVGQKYSIGKASFTIIAPNDNYGNINDNSVVVRINNGKNSFVFMGDCEENAIEDILDNEEIIDSDVLMTAHHGSETSISQTWLNSISPDYAVISVGKNSYGHPSDETMELLKENDIQTYRTDKNGTIVATSTGKKITFNCDPVSIKIATRTVTPTPISTVKLILIPTATPIPTVTPTITPTPIVIIDTQSETVYITSSGSCYHTGYCSYLSKSKIPISLNDAKKSYSPCSRCHPPQ